MGIAHRLIRQEKRYRMLYTIFLFLILIVNGGGSSMSSDSDTENDDKKSKDNNYDEEDVTPYLLGREQEYDGVLGNADVVEERPDYNMRRVSSKASIMMETEDNKASNNNNFTFSDRNILAIVIFIGVIIGVLAITLMLLKTPTNFDSSSEDLSSYNNNSVVYGGKGGGTSTRIFPKDNSKYDITDYSTIKGGPSTYKNMNPNLNTNYYGTNNQNYQPNMMYTQQQLYNGYNPYANNVHYPSMNPYIPNKQNTSSYGPVPPLYQNYIGGSTLPTNAFGSNIFGGDGQKIPLSSRNYISKQNDIQNNNVSAMKNKHLDDH